MWFKVSKSHPDRDKCDICRNEFTGYMVKNNLWPREHSFLCLGCFVNKLGRMVTIDDFQPCGWTNRMLLGFKLARGEKIDLTGF